MCRIELRRMVVVLGLGGTDPNPKTRTQRLRLREPADDKTRQEKRSDKSHFVEIHKKND